jgi:hypothetical protein
MRKHIQDTHPALRDYRYTNRSSQRRLVREN